MHDDAATPPASTSAPSAPAWWGPVAVLVVGAAAYANALGGPMVFDDRRQILENPLVRDLAGMLSVTGYRALPTRFVAYVTFALNHAVGGTAPWGYHAVNVVIHLVTALLVHALVLGAFRTPRLRETALAPHARAVAFVAAALFVSHPLQTQAVTYIVQRIASLATLFYVATVVLWARWRLAPSDAGALSRTLHYLAVLVLALLACHTKETAVTLPAALLLYELAFLAPGRRRSLALLPVVAIAALVPLLRLAPGQPIAVSGLAALTRVDSGLSRLDYLLTEGPVVVRYLFLLLLPVGQNLDPDVPVFRSLLDPEVASAVAVHLALLGLAAFLLLRTRRGATRPIDPAARLAAFGVAWWYLTLSVESSILPIADAMNEHRVYLPSVGAFAALAVGLVFLTRRVAGATRAGRVATAVGAALSLALAGATLARNTVWRSEVALWADAATKSPDKVRPVLNLGTSLATAGRFRDAVAPLRRAVRLDPGSAYAHAQLAAALLSAGRPAEAEPELREALRLAPGDVEATFNLAMLLLESNRGEEAGRWFARFLEIAPAAYADARRYAAAHAAR
jgi:tetratricopeptide (TPR) repeat protein